MLKITVKGEPNEIAAFFARLEDVDGVQVEYSSAISKRAAHHKWGSAIAGITANTAGYIDAEFSIYERGRQKGQPQKGFVYLLPAYGENGLIGYKIGKTTNPLSRRKTFSIKLNFEVKFLALIGTDDHSKLETELHRRFAAKRLGSSEWFTLSEEDVKYIQSLMTELNQVMLEVVNK